MTPTEREAVAVLMRLFGVTKYEALRAYTSCGGNLEWAKECLRSKTR